MAKRIQLENLTRDVLLFQLTDGSLFRLGDKADTDDVVPPTGRDEKVQPAPVVVLTQSEYDKLGAPIHLLLDDQIAQRRIRRLELSA